MSFKLNFSTKAAGIIQTTILETVLTKSN